MSQDSSGNYYFSGTSGAIMLDEVVIVGHAPSSSGSSGGSGFNYSGYFSSGNSILDYYAAYFASYGYNLTPTGGGNYIYNPPTPPPPPPSEDDPWKKGDDGKIVKTPTGKTLPNGDPYKLEFEDETLTFREVKIEAEDGTEIIAYEVTEVRDSEGNLKTIEDRHKSNCTGLAVANGEVWIFDSEIDGSTNETAAFESMLSSTQSNSAYSIVSKAQADFAVIWDTDSNGNKHIVHSGIINSQGKYIHKSNQKGQITSETEDAFKDKHFQPPNSNYTSSIVYYKNN
jgi:hypothetical protein